MNVRTTPTYILFYIEYEYKNVIGVSRDKSILEMHRDGLIGKYKDLQKNLGDLREKSLKYQNEYKENVIAFLKRNYLCIRNMQTVLDSIKRNEEYWTDEQVNRFVDSAINDVIRYGIQEFVNNTNKIGQIINLEQLPKDDVIPVFDKSKLFYDRDNLEKYTEDSLVIEEVWEFIKINSHEGEEYGEPCHGCPECDGGA